MIRLVIVLLSIAISQFATAQTIDDAVRYSFITQQNSARSLGAGGSMSPLGADISVATVNPAGIAEFRKSEIVLGFGVPIVSTDATLGGDTANRDTVGFKVSNLGLVLASNTGRKKIKRLNFSLGLNQIADFHDNILYDGITPGTRTERFIEQANLRTIEELDPFEGGPAFDVDLISDDDGDTFYESDFFTFEEEILKVETIERSGTFHEFFLNIAANHNEKLSFGLTVGFPIVNFDERRVYLEEDIFSLVPNFFDAQFIQNLSTSGSGVNFKGGIIYKLNSKIRLSAAIHSPTWLQLTDEFSTSLDFFTDDINVDGLISESPEAEFEYSLRTPWRALAGISTIYRAGKLRGFFTGEIEYVDYTNSSFNLTVNSNDPVDQFFEDDLNGEISDQLTQAINVRIGTELALSKFRVRVGAGLLQAPFEDSNLADVDLQLNGGIGWRENRWYVDVAISTRQQTQTFTPYRLIDASNNQSVEFDSRINQLALTLGYKL